MDETKLYSGHTITLTPNWDFAVSGPEFDKDESKYSIQFKSLDAAKAEIEKRTSETKKLQAKNVSFELKILNEKGEPKTATRINRQNSELTGTLDTSHFYPNVDWIKEAILRQVKLNQEIHTIDQALRPFRMSKSVGYGRMDAEVYALKVQSITKNFNELVEKAKSQNKLEAVPPSEARANNT
jgi:hypothetical protein